MQRGPVRGHRAPASPAGAACLPGSKPSVGAASAGPPCPRGLPAFPPLFLLFPSTPLWPSFSSPSVLSAAAERTLPALCGVTSVAL